MWRRLAPVRVAAMAAVLAQCPLGSTAAGTLPSGFSDEVVVARHQHFGLFPIAMSFLPDNSGRYLVVDKTGKLWLGDDTVGADLELYMALPDTFSQDEVGVLGVLPSVASDWATNPRVYVYWARYAEGEQQESMRLSSFEHNENGGGRASRGNYASEQVLWIDSDGFPRVNNQQYNVFGVLWHYGGGMSWGPDNRIYLSLGDKQKADWAPLPDKYSGCVLRLNTDGSIPPGNLDPSIKPPECWAYGVRNGFKSSWDLQPPGRERFFVAEVGGNDVSRAYEDLHLGGAGKHFGWPACEGPCANNPSYSTCSCQVHDDPIFTYPHNGFGACIIGGLVYRGIQFPAEYRGAYFFSEYVHQNIQLLRFNEDGGQTVVSNEIFQTGSSKTVSHMAESPDGSLWYIANPENSWNIRRIQYVEGDVAPIIHSLGPSVTSGTPPLQVTFTSHVEDPDSTSLTYSWSFGDGGTSSAVSPTHTFTTPGNYFVVLAVSDDQSTTQSEFVHIEVGTPPVVTVNGLTPEHLANGINVLAGEELHFQASAHDAIDGDISANLRWYDVFVHDNHTHPQGAEHTGTSYDIEVPTSGHSFEGSTGLRLTVEAVNGRGLRTSVNIFLWPIRSDLSIKSSPEGAAVLIDGTISPLPTTIFNIIGFRHVLTAEPNMCREGIRYSFSYWDAPQHISEQQPPAVNTAVATFSVLPTDSTITAVYAPTGYCTLYRVNAGGNSVTDLEGNTWVGDKDPAQWAGTLVHSPGGRFVTPSEHILFHPILTQEQEIMGPVFQNERWTTTNDGDVQYAFAIEKPGTYDVHIMMMEGWRSGTGTRLFDILLDDEIVYSNIDIFAEAGFQTPLLKTVRAQLALPGTITVTFMPKPGVEGPSIFSLEVEMISGPAPTGNPPAPPTTFAPTTPFPTTRRPTTAQPTTADPTTAPPTTADPTTVSPTTASPTTASPTTADPTTAPPTTAEPTTARPTTADPTSAPPTTASPTTAEPTTAPPTTADPTSATPSTADPTSAPPTTGSPSSAPPTTTEPTTAAPVSSSETVTHRINCGGPTLTDSGGELWESDSNYSPGGRTVTPSRYIQVSYTFTPETEAIAALFATERYTNLNVGDVRYNVLVPSEGLYQVEFILGETWHRNPYTRLFDIKLQGQTVFGSIDIVAEADFQKPLFKTATTLVGNSRSLEIVLSPLASAPEGPTLSGLRITHLGASEPTTTAPVAPPTSGSPTATVSEVTIYRVNCGGPSVEDAEGHRWVGDNALGYAVGGRVVRPMDHRSVNYVSNPITEALSPILEAERWSRQDLGNLEYIFAISEPGDYVVRILLVEAWHRNPGTRIFHIDIQDTPVFENVDVVAEFGFQNPSEKVAPVSVVQGENAIRIRFRPSASPEGPAVYGIRIIHVVGSTSSPTPLPSIPTPQPSSPTLEPSSPTSSPPPPTAPTLEPSTPTLEPTAPTALPTAPTIQPTTPTSPPVTAPPSELPLVTDRFNCGGPTVVDSEGHTWLSDSDLSPGGRKITPRRFRSVAYTFTPETETVTSLFETERYSNMQTGSIQYTIPVDSNGLYDVELVFGESWHQDVNTRRFDIAIQSIVIFGSFSIYEEAGFQTTLVKTVTARVDGELSISIVLLPLSTSAEGPTISALRVTKISELPTTTPNLDRSVYRINCGGPNVRDENENVWLSDIDLGYYVGGKVVRPQTHRSVTLQPSPYTVPLATLFEFERYTSISSGPIEYVFSVEPGEYTIKMYFLESWHQQQGQRRFHIYVQGQPAFIDLDLISEFGFQRPGMKEAYVSINPDESEIRVKFYGSNSAPEGPAIYAIDVVHNVQTRHRRALSDGFSGFETITASVNTLQSSTGLVCATLTVVALMVGTLARRQRRAPQSSSQTRTQTSDIATDMTEPSEPLLEVRQHDHLAPRASRMGSFKPSYADV